MKKLLLLAVILTAFVSSADEGMYVPFKLKDYYKDMKNAGLKMSYKKIYNVDKMILRTKIKGLVKKKIIY